MKLRTNRKAKGFTLIEVLVVIAIMAALGAIAWVSVGVVQSKEANGTAQMHLDKIAAALNEYKANATTPMLWGNGDEASANALYQMLNSDFDGDGNPDKGLTPYCKELRYYDPESGEKPEGIIYTNIGKNKHAILDPWNNYYFYRLGYSLEGPKSYSGKGSKRSKGGSQTQKGKGINVDFDIFSLGEDGLGDGRTNKDENKDNISNIKFLVK
ncbi:MAG: type II secretion system protein [Akkermansia sp.]|nr:type II secretion system protein [Akkermansia sp.]